VTLRYAHTVRLPWDMPHCLKISSRETLNARQSLLYNILTSVRGRKAARRLEI